LPARKPLCESSARRSITWLTAFRSATLFLKMPREVLNAKVRGRQERLDPELALVDAVLLGGLAYDAGGMPPAA